MKRKIIGAGVIACSTILLIINVNDCNQSKVIDTNMVVVSEALNMCQIIIEKPSAYITVGVTKNIIEVAINDKIDISVIENKDEIVKATLCEKKKEKPKKKKDKKNAKVKSVKSAKSKDIKCNKKYSPETFKRLGKVWYGNYTYTWYSQRVLPGGGLKIPGRHVNNHGFVCDKDGYICVASDDLRKGTIVSTPVGILGKVYDCGSGYGNIDLYVNW